MILKTFGSNLKYLRQIKGDTQEEAAARLYISRQTLSDYEKGRHFPNEQVLIRICQYYNYTNLYRLLISDITTSYLKVA